MSPQPPAVVQTRRHIGVVVVGSVMATLIATVATHTDGVVMGYIYIGQASLGRREIEQPTTQQRPGVLSGVFCCELHLKIAQ